MSNAVPKYKYLLKYISVADRRCWSTEVFKNITQNIVLIEVFQYESISYVISTFPVLDRLVAHVTGGASVHLLFLSMLLVTVNISH